MANFINHQFILNKFNKVFNSNKAAIFDLDHTIIKPKNGKRFSITDLDWEFNSDNVIQKLKYLDENNYDIIILSNQKGLKTENSRKLWVKKINKIGKKINISIFALASLKDDKFRKPRTGLWNKFLSHYDKNESFYCGDAGGLPKRKINKEWIKKDFSDSDLKFALNVGLPFHHRDEYFYNSKNIKLTPSYIDFNSIKRGKYDDFIIKKNTMIINVGYAGSGKSYFSKNHIKQKYVYINRDTSGNLKKCIKDCEKAIMNKQSIVVDNTNPSKDNRKIFIDIAKKSNYDIICLNFTTSRDISMHNNIYRSFCDDNNSNRQIVPKIAYNIYKSKYEAPTKNEGFTEIRNIDFILDDNKLKEDSYFKYFY